MQEWTYKSPKSDGFYWYAEEGHMAVAYVTFLSDDLKYQRQTVAEVEFLNGAGYWPKREIETCTGLWMKLDAPE